MTSLSEILSSDRVHCLGWTLLHSLWEIALVAAVLALVLAALRRRSANVRYLTACVGLVAAVVLPIVTYCVMPDRPAWEVSATGVPSDNAPETSTTPPSPSVDVPGIEVPSAEMLSAEVPSAELLSAEVPGGELPNVEAPVIAPSMPVEEKVSVPAPPERPQAHETSTPLLRRVAQVLSPWMPWCVLAWLLGVVSLSVWNLGGWIAAQRLKHLGTTPAGEQPRARVADLVRRMKVSRPVRMLQSCLLDVPIVVGWLRPVILMPVGILTGFSPAQLDAILAHELAHIRRHDYLVNLLQTVAETLLFYHPGVWWISRRIRIEREHCCDDAAVAVCGSNVDYAAALTALEESRAAPRLAVATTGTQRGGTALGRVRRVLGLSGNDSFRWRSSLAGSLTVLLLATLVGYMAMASGSDRNPGETAATEPTTQPAKGHLALLVDGIKPKYAQHEPIVTAVTLQNDSDKTVKVQWPDIRARTLIVELEKDGTLVPPQVRWSSAGGGTEAFQLLPGRSHTARVEITDVYPSGIEPGKYKLALRYRAEGIDLRSKTIEFEVTPPAEEDREAFKAFFDVRGERKKQIELYLQVIKKYPKSRVVPRARLELIRLYTLLKRGGEAGQLEELLKDPLATQRMRNVGICLTVCAYEESGDLPRAIHYYRQATRDSYLGVSSIHSRIGVLQPKLEALAKQRLTAVENSYKTQQFMLLRFHGQNRNVRRPTWRFGLPAPPAEPRPLSDPYVQITEAQTRAVLKVLTASGFFERALSFDMADPHYDGPVYSLQIHTGKRFYEENLGYDRKTWEVLGSLRKALAGNADAVEAMDKLLGLLGPQRREWEETAKDDYASLYTSLRVSAGKVRAKYPRGGIKMWRELASLLPSRSEITLMKLVLPQWPNAAGNATLWDAQHFTMIYSLDKDIYLHAKGIGRGRDGNAEMILLEQPRIHKGQPFSRIPPDPAPITRPAVEQPLPGARMPLVKYLRTVNFVAVCEANEEPKPWRGRSRSGFTDFTQQFKVLEVLLGDVKPNTVVPLTYRCSERLAAPWAHEKPIPKGRKVIWVVRGQGDSHLGVKALRDTREHREAVRSLVRKHGLVGGWADLGILNASASFTRAGPAGVVLAGERPAGAWGTLYESAAAGKVPAGTKVFIARMPGGSPYGGGPGAVEYGRLGNTIRVSLEYTYRILPPESLPDNPESMRGALEVFGYLPPLPPGEYELHVVCREYIGSGRVAVPAPESAPRYIPPFRASFTIAPVTPPPAAGEGVNVQQAGQLLLARDSAIVESKRIFVGKVVDLNWQEAKMRRITTGDMVGYVPETRRGTAVFECVGPIRGVPIGQRVTLDVLKDICKFPSSGSFVTTQMIREQMFDRIQIQAGSQWLLCVGEGPVIDGIAYVPGGNEPVIQQTRGVLILHAMPVDGQMADIITILSQKKLSDNNPLIRYVLDHVADDRYRPRRLQMADVLNAGFLEKTNTSRLRYLMLERLAYLARDKTGLGKQISLRVRRWLLEDAVAIESADRGLLQSYVHELAGSLGMFEAPDALPVFPKDLQPGRPADIAEALRRIAGRFEQYAADTRAKMEGFPAGDSSRQSLAEELNDLLQKKDRCLTLATALDEHAGVSRTPAAGEKTPKARESAGRSNGIAFSIVAEAKTVYLGEPLGLSFVAKNVSDHDVVLPVHWGFQCFSMEVTHGGDTYKEGNPFCPPYTPTGLRAVTLAPNESYTLRIDLLRLLRLVSPSRKGQKVGTCSIRAELTSSGWYPYQFHNPPDYRECWKGSVTAELDVEVLPPESAADAAAVKILQSGGSGAPEITDNLWSVWHEVRGRGDERFSTILEKHPDSPLAPYCHLALAKSYAYAAESEEYRQQRDPFRSKVIEHCQAILKDYPKSRAVKPAKDLLEKAATTPEVREPPGDASSGGVPSESDKQAIAKHILTMRTNPSVNAKQAACEALAEIGLPSLEPLMDFLHQAVEAKPGDKARISPRYVEEAIWTVCKRVGLNAERAILKRFLQTANEKERKHLFHGLVGGSSYPKALAHLLDAIRAEGALHGNAKWGVEQVVHFHVHGGWGRDEAAISELLGIFSRYPDLQKEYSEIRQHLTVLKTVGAPKKETTFSPVKHRSLPIVVDEMTEFFVALPKPGGGWGYHWGVGKGRKPDLDWREHGLLYLGRTLGKDKVYYRLVGVRALKTPLNAHVQGGLSDDDPPEYPMTLTVRALPPEERAKRLRELLSTFDERKKKYAEALLSEEKPSAGKENVPDEADAERKKADAEREADEKRKKANAEREADENRKKANAEREADEKRKKDDAEREAAEVPKNVDATRMKAEAIRKADAERKKTYAEMEADERRKKADAEKEMTFSPVKHRPLPIVVDELTEFVVALPKPDGAWAYHWGVTR